MKALFALVMLGMCVNSERSDIDTENLFLLAKGLSFGSKVILVLIGLDNKVTPEISRWP